MRYNSVLNKTDITSDEKVRTNFVRNKPALKNIIDSPVLENLIAKGEDDLINYLHLNGLADESGMLVLPSGNHYYYDSEDLIGVSTLINQKELNLIKQLNDFLSSVYNVLSPQTNFIGCFSDCKTQKGVGLISRMYRKIINFLDAKFNVAIDKEDISRLFESVGFKVMDMTEINGLTYFLIQN